MSTEDLSRKRNTILARGPYCPGARSSKTGQANSKTVSIGLKRIVPKHYFPYALADQILSVAITQPAMSGHWGKVIWRLQRWASLRLLCLCCWISGAVLVWFVSVPWWPRSREALQRGVNFQRVGGPVGVSSTRTLSAVCMLSHFARSGSLYKFYCLWKHLKMTSTSTADEKGSKWAGRGWKKRWGKQLLMKK